MQLFSPKCPRRDEGAISADRVRRGGRDARVRRCTFMEREQAHKKVGIKDKRLQRFPDVQRRSRRSATLPRHTRRSAFQRFKAGRAGAHPAPFDYQTFTAQLAHRPISYYLRRLMPRSAESPQNAIIIRGARQNNLKGIDLDLELNRFHVITGPSGSGKSSLAFDTIYAEGRS